MQPSLLSSTARQLSISTQPWMILLLGIVSLAPSAARGAVIAGFDPARHSRFLTGTTDPNPAFFISESGLSESDISGVGFNPATLITPRHYITARHANTSAPIFRGSDGVVRTYSTSSSVVLSTTLPGGTSQSSDLMLFTLDAPIPVAHGVQPLALVAGDPTGLHGREILVFGQGNQAGRNVVDTTGIVAFAGGVSPTATIGFSFDTATNGGAGGLGDDETGLISGDSGLSALIQIDGQLAVIGTHYGIDVPAGSNPADGDRYDSFSSLVIPYLDQINAITTADGFVITTVAVSSVPEPNPALLAAVVGIFFAYRAGRRRRQ